MNVEDCLLERLPQDLQDVEAALGEFIQKEHAIVAQGHVARHRHRAPADQPRIREGMVGRATRAGRDHRRAGAGAAGNTLDAGGLYGFGGALLAEGG